MGPGLNLFLTSNGKISLIGQPMFSGTIFDRLYVAIIYAIMIIHLSWDSAFSYNSMGITHYQPIESFYCM